MAAFKILLQRLWIAAFVAAALFFVYSWFRDDADKAARLLSADPYLLVCAAASHVTYFVVTVLAWCACLRMTSDRTASFYEGLSQILLVNFGKYIPGKIWGIAARGTRLKTLGYSMHEIGKASYLEQALLLLTGFWLAFLAAFIVYGQMIYLGLLLLTSSALVLMRYGDIVIEWLVKFFPAARTALEYVDVRVGSARFAGLSGAYVLVWLFLSASFIFMSLAVMPLEMSTRNIAIFVLSLTAGYLAGFIAIFAPGGVGVREGVGAAILGVLMPLQDAVVLMLLFRIWVVLWELIAGSALVVGRRKDEILTDAD